MRKPPLIARISRIRQSPQHGTWIPALRDPALRGVIQERVPKAEGLNGRTRGRINYVSIFAGVIYGEADITLAEMAALNS